MTDEIQRIEGAARVVEDFAAGCDCAQHEAQQTCARAALALVELAPLLDALVDERVGPGKFRSMSPAENAAIDAWLRIRAGLGGEG